MGESVASHGNVGRQSYVIHLYGKGLYEIFGANAEKQDG